MNARLYCRTGALAGSEYTIDEEATIGRREQNDITLPADAVSERHARIFFDEGADCYVLEDLDSGNGTHLDATEVVDPEPLNDLHIITFGQKVDFIFQAVSEDASTSSPEEEAKTQFGAAPEVPSDLSEEDEPDGDRTRYGAAPGALPDLPEEESSSEGEESPPEEEPEGERTRFGAAPGSLPDLSEEESSPEAEEEESAGEEERTRFGGAPELPDLSEEDESDGDRTRYGAAPGALPDLPEDESSSMEEEASTEEDESDGDRTRYGEAPGALPDLPGEESTSKEEVEPADSAPASSEAPPQASPQYALHVILKDGPEDTHPLPEGEVTIGRSPDCDVQIEDPGVSREHAQLTVKSDEVVLKDVGSKNFTFVDGDRLSGPKTLSPGSEIQFGLQVKAILQRTSS